jgi:serine/threonine protein kinase
MDRNQDNNRMSIASENDSNAAKKTNDIDQKINDMKITNNGEPMLIRTATKVYECNKKNGKGSFGVVYQATDKSNNEVVAIKRVLQDRRYKNRELQIMKMVHHPNIVTLKDSFYENQKEEVFLNLVLDYMPKNLYEVASTYNKQRKQMPILHTKVIIHIICYNIQTITNTYFFW